MIRSFFALLPVALLAAGAAVADTSEHVGQIVCSQCWFEADRTRVDYGTPGDLDCAKRCAARGVRPALAVRTDAGFELVALDGGPGSVAKGWGDLTARFVRVSGVSGVSGEGKSIRVQSVEVLDERPWPAARAHEPGAVAMEWTDLGGQPLALDGLHGRIVVLNFWATWCAPCVKEMPDLVKIQNRYGMFGVQVLGAAADFPDDRERVIRFGRDLKVNFPILLGATTAQMDALGLGVALPATAILDRHGHVVERIRGVVKPADLEAALERLLESGATGGDHGHDHRQAGPVRQARSRGSGHDAHHGAHASLVPS